MKNMNHLMWLPNLLSDSNKYKNMKNYNNCRKS